MPSPTRQNGINIDFTGDATVTFEVVHCENNKTFFDVLIDGARTGIILQEGVAWDALADGWDDTFVEFDRVKFNSGLIIDDLGIPYEIGEQLIISHKAGINSFSHSPATTKKLKGVGQWFTNLLRFNYIDSSYSHAINAFRAWDLKLAYRFGALIRPPSLVINTNQGVLPSTAFNIILKKSEGTESKWISGIRVQLVQIGSKKLNSIGRDIPATDAADWIFRVENYNSQHPIIERYVLDSAGEFQTFYALNKEYTDIAWKKYTDRLSLEQTAMPVTITGLQNAVNFIYGYVDRLEELGWMVDTDETPAIDNSTGRTITWQLEIEKLINKVYSGWQAGAGFIINPFMNRLTLQTPVGLLGKYSESNFNDIDSSQAVYDVTGKAISIESLNVIRTDDSASTISLTPIFSAHVFVDEFEHTILMNKRFSEENASATIFDPFLGQNIDTAYLSFTRQENTDKKPSFNGFFLDGEGVSRNIVSSIDNFGKAYDATQTFGEGDTSKHALALLGYSKKDYFSSVSTSDATQFNFWRGLIQAKGTNMTVDAFVNYKKFIDASVDEYWAYKVAEYGDAREKSFPEIKINTADVTQKFTRLQFYSRSDANYSALPLFLQVEETDESRWYSIDDLGKGLKFEATKLVEQVIVPASISFPAYIKLKNIFHNGDLAAPIISGPSGASVIGANIIKVISPGTYTVSGFTWINPSKLSPIKLFDYRAQDLIEEIGLWHPAIGIHAYAPLEIINIINSIDPAQYNYSTKTTNNPNLRYLKPWGEREVGRVWWDTHNLGYIPYYDATVFSNRDSRDTRWGALAEWATVDLYQWTESTVPPSEYDALALEQEGDSSIDEASRASGRAALKKYYSRDRIIKIRPIAWSHATSGGAAAHPAFGPAEFTKVWASGNVLLADTGRVEAANLISGRNFGAWKNNKPEGEVQIGTDLVYDIGSSLQPGVPVSAVTGSEVASMRVMFSGENNIGRNIGQLALRRKNSSSGEISLRLIDSVGNFQDIPVRDWFSDNLSADSQKSFDFTDLGIKITVTRSLAGLITAANLVDSLTADTNDIFIREGIKFTQIIALPDSVFINDQNDPDYSSTEYEWRTWEVPTQEQLSSDLLFPKNSWLPYLGEQVIIDATPEIVATMQEDALVLKSGISINRFASYWTDWEELLDTRIEKISNGVDVLSFQLSEAADPSRLSIYLNGSQMNPSSYIIDGDTCRLLNAVNEGALVLLRYRSYIPTESELAFDPAEDDDVTIQTQYKVDYQYTAVDTRDSEGNISGTKYYFWVQDKTIPQANASMSLVRAKSILASGPGAFTLFSRLVPDSSGSAAYDSCAISGLNRFVTKNDSCKLRFLRNFTLRDDPEEMNLKNTHTEWALIRKGQTSKIPYSLWMRLTDAVSGQDSGGNPLPSPARRDYDEKNGTRTRFGFKTGQIFADTQLVRASITDTILNTSLTIKIGSRVIRDIISNLDFSNSDTWFSDAASSRATMNLIWATARPSQINEIFFSVLDDALADNYEFSDIFKTSYITVGSRTQVQAQQEQTYVFVIK